MPGNTRRFFAIALSVIALLLLWGVVARCVGSSFILPGPLQVLSQVIELGATKGFWLAFGSTCLRGLFAFIISMVLSVGLGFASGRSATFAALLAPWLSVIKSTPVVSFILIALLWFGSSTVPIFVAILMTLPVMTEATAHGIRSSDKKLLEMAAVYELSKKDIAFHILLPSALPFFLAGAGASLGLTWKVVIAGEILSVPRVGLGSAMQIAKVHLETPRVFALTVTAIALSAVTEWLFNALVNLSRTHLIQEGNT